MISDNLLALGLGELLEEVGVNFSGVVALMEQGPTERTQQIHVQLAEARLGTEEVVLVLLPLVLAARYARQERQDKSSAVQVDDTRLPRFRGLEPALKHFTNQFQIVIQKCQQVCSEQLGPRLKEEIIVLVPENVDPDAETSDFLVDSAIV